MPYLCQHISNSGHRNPGTCPAVPLESEDSVDSAEGVGDKGGGVGEDDDEVSDSVGPGEDEMSEGVRSDKGGDESDG